MLTGMYTSALGAAGQETKLTFIANNIANVNTPGYRAQKIAFVERLTAALEKADLQFYNRLIDRYGGAPRISGTHIDKTPGRIERTDAPFDFAIDGEGFFMVQDKQTGETYLTRAGDFSLSADGNLVTKDGRYTLLSRQKEPVKIPVEVGGSFNVLSTGEIFSGTELLGNVGVFDARFEDLRNFGENLFTFDEEKASPISNPRIQQGFIERSSVNPIVEMTDLISVGRMIEMNLNLLKAQDQTLDRAINDLGRAAR